MTVVRVCRFRMPNCKQRNLRSNSCSSVLTVASGRLSQIFPSVIVISRTRCRSTAADVRSAGGPDGEVRPMQTSLFRRSPTTAPARAARLESASQMDRSRGENCERRPDATVKTLEQEFDRRLRLLAVRAFEIAYSTTVTAASRRRSGDRWVRGR